jgi:hypothetical protein
MLVAPSLLHEGILMMFRNRPELAPELLRSALDVDVPPFSSVVVESGDLTEPIPTEYRADLVLVLRVAGKPVLAVAVEAQLRRDEEKRIAWPSYVTGLRKRFGCPALVLVVTPDEKLAVWCRTPIELGPRSFVTPIVIGPGSIRLFDDPVEIKDDPELALLAVMTHRRRSDAQRVAKVALEVLGSCEQGSATQVLYWELLKGALSVAARTAMEDLMASNPEHRFDFKFEKKARAEGREEGREEGRRDALAVALLTVLEARGLTLTVAQRAQIEGCGQSATLEIWLQRAARATTVKDVLTEP